MPGSTRLPQYVADLSLALINRTGAYHLGSDVVEMLPQFFARTRYWRASLNHEPPGLVRRLLGRAMMFELNYLDWARRLPVGGWSAGGIPTVFFDALYVLGTDVHARDIVLCHDIGPITRPDLFEDKTVELYREAYARIRAARPGVVFVSETSRSEFISRFGEDFRFLMVIPLYVRAGLQRGREKAPPGISPPFLLTVAATERRKNYPRVIEAFVRSGLRERGFSYVFCGPRGNAAGEVTALARSTARVHALGYVADAELRWLYRHASGFVLPSLLEGFGLPALEAAQHGLVSLVADIRAQREAASKGAMFADPNSVDAIAKGMTRLVDMTSAERNRRLAIARRHAAVLTLERYVARWSEVLGPQQSPQVRAYEDHDRHPV